MGLAYHQQLSNTEVSGMSPCYSHFIGKQLEARIFNILTSPYWIPLSFIKATENTTLHFELFQGIQKVQHFILNLD